MTTRHSLRIDYRGITHAVHVANGVCFVPWCDASIMDIIFAQSAPVVTCVRCWHKILTSPRGKP